MILDNVNHDIDDKEKKKLGELQPGNYANLKLKNKNIDCPLLFSSQVHDLPAPSFMKSPLKYIPGLMKADYTYNDRIKVHPWYISENFPTYQKSIGKENYNSYRNDQWSKKKVDENINAVLRSDWEGSEGAYGVEETETVFKMINSFKDKVKDKRVLVVGSETPWVEAIVLAVGAKHVTTLEYNEIISTHPQV